KFCASGLRNQGTAYQRSLTTAEIMEQCKNIISEMDFSTYPLPLLLSFMGEGEPFLNFEACVGAFREFCETQLSVPLRLAASTSGIRPDLIMRLGEMIFSLPLKLQISLHGPTDYIRRQIVPVTKSLSEIVPAVCAYRKQCNRPVEWNYVLCEGVNDDREHARQLVTLLGPGWHVKFNRLNLVPNSPFERSTPERLQEFRRILEAGGISTEYYETDESRVASGCGQLSYSSERYSKLRS
ncbi:MAG: hypothetical protein Q7R94_01600, partial [bacterium]|nr:hypothetical protein [bacterium]